MAPTNGQSSRDRFLANVRRALGRPAGSKPPDDYSSGLDSGRTSVEEVWQDMNDRADELTAHLARSASEIGWQVARAQSAETAADYVVEVARSLEAKSVVR